MANLQGFVDSVEAGRFSWIDGGRHLVDFCHVDNLAHAIALALTKGEHGLVCYITDDNPRTAREFFVPLLATRGVDVSKAGSFPRAMANPVATLMEAVSKARRSAPRPPSPTGSSRSWAATEQVLQAVKAKSSGPHCPRRRTAATVLQ